MSNNNPYPEETSPPRSYPNSLNSSLSNWNIPPPLDGPNTRNRLQNLNSTSPPPFGYTRDYFNSSPQTMEDQNRRLSAEGEETKLSLREWKELEDGFRERGEGSIGLQRSFGHSERFLVSFCFCNEKHLERKLSFVTDWVRLGLWQFPIWI